MAYADWIQVILDNKSNKALKTSGAYLQWGKFYDIPDNDKEVPTESVNNQPIPSKDTFQFASCGREHAASGTEGQIDIMDGDKRIFQLYWDCPFTGSNVLSRKYVAKNWYIDLPSVSPSGAIGTVTVSIIYQGM